MAKQLKTNPGIWVAAFDIHSPKIHKPTFNAMLDFLKKNEIAGFLFGGDQNDNEEISHHNKSKILFRSPGSYARNTQYFDDNVLTPIEKVTSTVTQRVWIEGNHDNWEDQLIQEQPELMGTIERRLLLNLDKRRWHFVPTGHIFQLGKLKVIHGETLSGMGNQASANHATKALLAYSSSVLYGHIHAPQSASRIAPFSQRDKFMAWCSPILGETNPTYLRNRPTAWVNGFTIVEVAKDGVFNVYPIVVTRGRFMFGGKSYGVK